MTPREYYSLTLEDFESAEKGIAGDNYLVKTDGYCFAYDSDGNELITFVFTVTPLEKDMDVVVFPVLLVKQNEDDLRYSEIPGIAYDFKNGFVNAMTKPWMTNGFEIPYTAIYDAVKDEDYHISRSYRLKNLSDNVTFEFSQISIDPITVTIPQDAFPM